MKKKDTASRKRIKNHNKEVYCISIGVFCIIEIISVIWFLIKESYGFSLSTIILLVLFTIRPVIIGSIAFIGLKKRYRFLFVFFCHLIVYFLLGAIMVFFYDHSSDMYQFRWPVLLFVLLQIVIVVILIWKYRLYEDYTLINSKIIHDMPDQNINKALPASTSSVNITPANSAPVPSAFQNNPAASAPGQIRPAALNNRNFSGVRRKCIYDQEKVLYEVQTEYMRKKGINNAVNLSADDTKIIYKYAMMPLTYYFYWMLSKNWLNSSIYQHVSQNEISDCTAGSISPLAVLEKLNFHPYASYFKPEALRFTNYFFNCDHNTFNYHKYAYLYSEEIKNPDEYYYCIDFSWDSCSRLFKKIDEEYSMWVKNTN